MKRHLRTALVHQPEPPADKANSAEAHHRRKHVVMPICSRQYHVSMTMVPPPKKVSAFSPWIGGWQTCQEVEKLALSMHSHYKQVARGIQRTLSPQKVANHDDHCCPPHGKLEGHQLSDGITTKVALEPQPVARVQCRACPPPTLYQGDASKEVYDTSASPPRVQRPRFSPRISRMGRGELTSMPPSIRKLVLMVSSMSWLLRRVSPGQEPPSPAIPINRWKKQELPRS
jgi:hypothetical protein